MILKQSQKSLFNFLKDFEICPGIVSKQAAYKLFIDDSREMAVFTPTGIDILTKQMNRESKINELVQMDKLRKQTGRCFTFFRFLDLLVNSSLIAFSDPYFN